jgi:hypothetical protein
MFWRLVWLLAWPLGAYGMFILFTAPLQGIFCLVVAFLLIVLTDIYEH